MKRGLRLRRQRRITISLAPVLAPYHLDTNPRSYEHCSCCRAQWAPADCPVTHTSACPDCSDAA